MPRFYRRSAQNGRHDRNHGRNLCPPPTSRISSKPRCPDLTPGRPAWGDSCRFRHDIDVSPPLSATASPESSPALMTPATSVSNPGSDGGHYLGRDAVPGGDLSRWIRNLTRAQPARTACPYYAHGYCRNGSRCPRSHAAGASDSSELPPTFHVADADVAGDEDAEIAHQIFPNTRNMAGALVRFGDGVVVQHAFFPTEISAARLADLPPGTTAAKIQREFAHRGFFIAREYIHLDGTIAAVVSTSPAFASAVCGVPWTWSTGEKVTVSWLEKPPIPLPVDPVAGRVSYHKVDARWPRRSEKLMMTWRHDRGSSARFVASNYQRGFYRVKGQRANARYLGATRDGHVVELSGLPDVASVSDVYEGIALHNRPDACMLGPAPSSDGDVSDEISRVQSMYTAIAPIESFQCTPCGAQGPDFFRATVQFVDQEDARKAAETLNGLSEVPFWRKGVMTVSLIYTASFRMKTVVWDAIFSDYMNRVGFWVARHVVVRFPLERSVPFKSVRLEGISPGGVVATRSDFFTVKTQFEKLLRGKHVYAADGRTPLWHPALANSDSIVYVDMQRIAREVGVLIQGNIAKSELRMFGPIKNCAAAGKRLRMLFGILTRHPFLTLDPDERADQQRRRLAAPSAKAAHQDCVACCTPSDKLVSTPCGHRYCPECFQNGCIAGTSTDSGFRCVAEDCKAVIPLCFVEGKLPPAVFGDVLQRAFNSYVQRHTEQLRFCSSPACGLAYRLYAHLRSGNAPSHVCGGCLGEYCSGCGSAPHAGYTCEDHREIKAGTDKYTRMLRQQLGIKDCPKCGVGIEKLDGCNHVKCTACDCHMCWKCMFYDKEERSIYAHMQQEHGRYVDGSSDDSGSDSGNDSDSDEGEIANRIYRVQQQQQYDGYDVLHDSDSEPDHYHDFFGL